MWDLPENEAKLRIGFINSETTHQKINFLNAISLHAFRDENCEANVLHTRNLSLAQNPVYTKGIADGHYILGRAYSYRFLWKSAHTNYKTAYEMYTQTGDSYGQLMSALQTSYISSLQQKWDDVFKFVEITKSLNLSVTPKPKDNATYFYHLGVVYFELGNHFLAAEYFSLAIQYGKPLMKESMYAHLGVFGGHWYLSSIYEKENDKEKAYEHAKLSLKHCTNDNLHLLNCHFRLGLSARLIGETWEAYTVLTDGIALFQGDEYLLVHANIEAELAMTCHELGNLDRAKKLLQKSIKLYEEREHKRLPKAYLEMAAILLKQQNSAEAYRFLELYNSMHPRIWQGELRKEFAIRVSAQERVIRDQEAEIYRLRNIDLHEKNVQLEASLDKQEELVGIIAHDLRTPLFAISLNLESSLLHAPELPNRYRAHLTSATQQVNLMTRLIDRLLDSHALETGLLPMQIELVNLNPIIQSVVHEAQTVASSKKIMLKFEPLAEEIPIMASEALVRGIFENLISNSLKFSYPDSSVMVEARLVGELVQVDIADEGVGLSEDDKKAIFSKFADIKNEPTAGEKSSGLGLYIVKKYVKKVKGDIEVFSEGYGHGSTFRVTFQLVQPAE